MFLTSNVRNSESNFVQSMIKLVHFNSKVKSANWPLIQIFFWHSSFAHLWCNSCSQIYSVFISLSHCCSNRLENLCRFDLCWSVKYFDSERCKIQLYPQRVFLITFQNSLYYGSFEKNQEMQSYSISHSLKYNWKNALQIWANS